MKIIQFDTEQALIVADECILDFIEVRIAMVYEICELNTIAHRVHNLIEHPLGYMRRVVRVTHAG